MDTKQKERLLILSHTPHYRSAGRVVGWGPTISEINHLATLFAGIVHIAPLHGGTPPATALPYQQRVSFVPIKPFGGPSPLHKAAIWRSFVEVKRLLEDFLPATDVLHIRLPMGLAVFLLPWLRLVYKKKIWFKYAGNLDQVKPPLGYAIQRFYLKTFYRQSIVTCNGSKSSLPGNFIRFENPCLTKADIAAGAAARQAKNFQEPLKILFVGHIAANKGVYRLIEMCKLLPADVAAQVESITFVGDGETAALQRAAQPLQALGIAVNITGGRSRKELNEHYARAHLIVLPSDSEGFPKVIAEAAAWGCVPVVSDVSALQEYINPGNGHIFSRLEPGVMAREFAGLISDRNALATRADNILQIAPLFTFDHYLDRVANEILPAL